VTFISSEVCYNDTTIIIREIRGIQMQYGAELLTYQRTKGDEKDNKVVNRSEYLRYLVYFVMAILISRVILINKTAPFGIAFMISILMRREEKLSLIVGCGSLIGYITLFNNIENLILYTIVIASLIGVSFFIGFLSKRKSLILIFFISYAEYIIYNLVIHRFSLGTNLLFSSFDVVCIFPLYYIMDYSILCMNEFRTKHLFSNEEIISMAIVASLVISGTWGVQLFGISFRNILALTFVIVISFVNGSSTGAAAGVAMGAIVGMGTENMIAFISVYGLCGLIVGLFKDTGKWISILSYIIAFCILKLYSNIGLDFKIIEAIITCGIFLFIPQKIYNQLSFELDWEKKQEKNNVDNVDKIRSVFLGRLESFSDVLYNMSSIVNNLVNNDKLLMKSKSSALIENLADRVCANCDMNSICWKRELHYTYSAFGELIQNYQENKPKVPQEIERKCVKRTHLVKNTEEIVNNHIISEMWRNRLTEGRQILAGQINNMAISIKEIMDEFHTNIKFNNEIDKNLRKLFNKNQIKFNDIFCYEDKNGRIKIQLSMNSCEGRESCVKEVLPLVNQVAGTNMSVSDEGCSINPKYKTCLVRFEETPKYHVASYVGRECKNGEKYNGDSYSFGKLKDGTYMTVISDGMGSGPEAGQESKAAVELVEKFAEAGFSNITSINTVNSIMSLKFSEDEKFSTLDMSSLDLYSGEVDFMKVGASASYIKRGDKVDVIRSKTLPIGVLDKVDIEVVSKKVKNGDIIVMMSDGVGDSCERDGYKGDWIKEFLEDCTESNPKEILNELTTLAKKLCNGKPKDDMTLIVSKVYSIH
jgi:stage II sporulation protein E